MPEITAFHIPLTEEDILYRAKWTQAIREDYHKTSPENFAGDGLDFPIKDGNDVKDAWNLAGHGDNPDKIRSRVKSIAKRLGLTSHLPDTATGDDSDEKEERMDASTPIETPELEPIAEQVPETENTSEQTPEEVPTNSEEMERTEIPEQVFLHADIIRIDKNKREVTGVATSEAVDTFGTVFAYDASKKAFQGWIERAANVREMHDKKAVGKGIGVRFDDENKKIFVTTRVSRSADGDNAWTKIEEGILNGFSVGASGRTAVWDTVERNGKKYPYLVKYDLSELSLVDNASNPDAQGLVIARADALVEEVVDITEPETEQQQTTPSQVIVSSPSVSLSDVSVASSDLERAGARVSSKSKSALHDARNSSVKSAMSLMSHCGCEQCKSIHDALDPDDDGDIDFMSMDDPDGDAETLGMERTQEADLKQVETNIEGIIERVFTSTLTAFTQRQQHILTRFASIDIPVPEVPEVHFDPELLRSVVSAEIASLVTPLEERLTTALEGLSSTSSLSEVREVLTSVKETVERIASQPASGGPVLNGGHPIDKRLATSPMSANAQIDPRSFWDEAQRRGLLTTPELQMQAAAATAIPMQLPRRS